MKNTGQDLVKRIASLVRQNQDLNNENEDLRNQVNDLKTELEVYKKDFSISRSEKIEGKILLEKATSLRFNMATVMFADIHGFENIKEGMDSAQVMDDLDEILFHFDEILKKYKIQKIKTIGDTIMAAGGVPKKNMTNPVDVVLAAIEMQNFLKDHCAKDSSENKIWNLKIGIHTGPVTATISGKKKKTYEIKGDTVNMATRMQSYARDGDIHISVMTYELTKEFFECEYFGKMPVKYKADLEIFDVKALKPEFSEDNAGSIPNEKFGIKFKLIQFMDIQELILDKLEKELPSYLYYHNVKHTVDVVTEVELMGWAESVTDEEILLLKTAGLFHDAGHTVEYDEHEYHGTVMVKEMLPDYGYSEDQINRICDIIMATKMPPQPKDLLQRIICDADLDYLGRSDMIPVSNTLYEELKEQNKIGTIDDWNRLQIKFISVHQYFTQTARSLREVNKQLQIERIRSLLPEE
ncbi:MAG: HD domain-containing protein [Bacteroidales bacterium]|nr:HD domain-containing protein [Bacteroidales bacterium]